MTAGEQTRELTYVSDIVEGYLYAAITPEARGRVVNLGSGQEHRVRDVVERIFALSQSRGRPLFGAVPYRAAEVWRCVSSIETATTLLGWRPRVTLEEGLRHTIAWYRAQLAHTEPAAA
jgi:nucleoside-diphosphate-sugar epimerase